jgi:hypothetical protein
MKWAGFAAVVMLSTLGSACASYGDYRYRHDDRYRRDAYQQGFERGMREGQGRGYHDGRRDARPDFWRDRQYRDADAGYRSWMGSRREYENGFRRGYAQSYRRAYNASTHNHRHDRWERWDNDRDGRWDNRYDYSGPRH